MFHMWYDNLSYLIEQILGGTNGSFRTRLWHSPSSFAVGIIALVLLQEGQQQNENRVGGGSSSDTFLSKNKGRTIDAFLSRWTTIIALGFFAFVIVINAIIFFTTGSSGQ